MYTGIIHITDTHFNEIININNNSYDMNIASARLKKFANNLIPIFKAYNINKVLIASFSVFVKSDASKSKCAINSSFFVCII